MLGILLHGFLRTGALEHRFVHFQKVEIVARAWTSESHQVRGLFQTNGGWAAFVLRIVLGIVFFAHGAQLALGWFGGQVFSESVGSFGKMGIPAPVAVLIILAQLLGGVGLLAGLLTRIAAFGIFSVMIGAIFIVHLKVGFL
jgi:putative oxidoreductase